MDETAASPIKDTSKLDLVIERTDGRLEMCIVAQCYLDGSPETLALLEEKVRNYGREALDESFRESYSVSEAQRVEIALISKFDVDPAVTQLIARLASELKQLGLKLTFKRY
jgi:hypothetical protein